MILSNVAIQDALDKGWLRIDPRPTPMQPTVGEQCPYNTSAVDLRLSREIVVPKDNLPVSVDLRKGGFRHLAEASSIAANLTADQPFALKPGQFVLGQTVETIEFPLLEDAPSLAARVEGRSSFARCGLLVHFTAPTVHAGFSGPLVLEMCNFGPYEILLYENIRICQLIVEEVKGVPFRNDSQFQSQKRPTGAA